jgi:cytochrome bd-type quinol oxidase subunit 2
MGLQTPSVPWLLSLAPSLGTLFFVQWMVVSIHFCICQALAKPLRRQLYQATVSMVLLASTIVSGFGGYLWDGSPGGAVSGWSVIPSVSALNFVPVTPSMVILFPFLRQTEVSTVRSFFFLSFMCFETSILGTLSFWANIYLSVSTCHVYSFVIGLPHLGRYHPDPSNCLRIL